MTRWSEWQEPFSGSLEDKYGNGEYIQGTLDGNGDAHSAQCDLDVESDYLAEEDRFFEHYNSEEMETYGSKPSILAGYGWSDQAWNESVYGPGSGFPSHTSGPRPRTRYGGSYGSFGTYAIAEATHFLPSTKINHYKHVVWGAGTAFALITPDTWVRSLSESAFRQAFGIAYNDPKYIYYSGESFNLMDSIQFEVELSSAPNPHYFDYTNYTQGSAWIYFDNEEVEITVTDFIGTWTGKLYSFKNGNYSSIINLNPYKNNGEGEWWGSNFWQPDNSEEIASFGSNGTFTITPDLDDLFVNGEGLFIAGVPASPINMTADVRPHDVYISTAQYNTANASYKFKGDWRTTRWRYQLFGEPPLRLKQRDDGTNAGKRIASTLSASSSQGGTRVGFGMRYH
jgi:hypothetical protein